MLYHWYEMSHAALKPARAMAESLRFLVESPFNPISLTTAGRHTAAALQVFERTTRRYEKPTFGLTETQVGPRTVSVREEVVWQRPFCRLIHFRREISAAERAPHPRILLVAPMSGHYATLLRGTVETLLPNHEVYITDWQDASAVPQSAGPFGLDDYVDYVREMLSIFRGDVHVYAVCQPAVPVLAAVSLMEQDLDPNVPLSMILAGGPVDTRQSLDGRQHRRRLSAARTGLHATSSHRFPGLIRALAAKSTRLHAALGLRRDEPRASCEGARRPVPSPRDWRRRLRREAS